MVWALESGIFWIISRGSTVRTSTYFGNTAITYGGLFSITKDGKRGFLHLHVHALLKYIRSSADAMVNFITILLKSGMTQSFKIKSKYKNWNIPLGKSYIKNRNKISSYCIIFWIFLPDNLEIKLFKSNYNTNVLCKQSVIFNLPIWMGRSDQLMGYLCVGLPSESIKMEDSSRPSINLSSSKRAMIGSCCLLPKGNNSLVSPELT